MNKETEFWWKRCKKIINGNRWHPAESFFTYAIQTAIFQAPQAVTFAEKGSLNEKLLYNNAKKMLKARK